MKNRIQKLPSIMHIGDQLARNIKLFWYDKDGIRHENGNSFKTELDAFKYVSECAKKGIAAYASAFIEEDQQAEVFTFSEVGLLKDIVYSRPIIQSVERAKKLVFKGNIPNISQAIVPVTKTETIVQAQTISKDKTHVVFIWYPEQKRDTTTPYAFKCRMAHKPGDYVVVMSGGLPTNVEVAYYREMCNDKVKALANSCGRNDLSWIEDDKPM